MLFKISKEDFFTDNPEAEVIPQFVEVGDQAMKYICLVYGYNSPYRLLSMEVKRRKALEVAKVYKTPQGRPSKLEKSLVDPTSKEIIAAIAEYQSIQFDEDRDTHEAYKEFVSQSKELLRKKDKDPKEMDQALKIHKEFTTLVENEKKLREILEIRSQEEFKSTSMNEDDYDSDDEDNELERYLSEKE